MQSYYGFEFEDAHGNPMCEFHVDDIKDPETLPELQGVTDGGKLSVHMPEDSQEHLVWGHDEVIANKKALRGTCWHGSDGQVPLRLKDLGASIHLSAVINRQKGWHPTPNEEQLEMINAN